MLDGEEFKEVFELLYFIHNYSSPLLEDQMWVKVA